MDDGGTFLSTPSARRATFPAVIASRGHRISIHALCEEGDRIWSRRAESRKRFLSTPSARRATQRFQRHDQHRTISIHALCEEGDQAGKKRPLPHPQFLSTPSARRATGQCPVQVGHDGISIHALCEEGDQGLPPLRSTHPDFYPRPLRGGRPRSCTGRAAHRPFLSTPSARRATPLGRYIAPAIVFLSTPSARRATNSKHKKHHRLPISIHALCEEGDYPVPSLLIFFCYFYPRPLRGGRPFPQAARPPERTFLSTPSARRATRVAFLMTFTSCISIHALCEEGDGAFRLKPGTVE